MNIERKFAWPSRFPTTKNEGRSTGSVGQIFRIVKGIIGSGKGWVDPMYGRSILCEIRNDFREKGTNAEYHQDALVFLKSLPSDESAGVVYDPPYNDRQGLKYCKDHHSYADLPYWWAIRVEIGRILRPGGRCVMLAWNSNKIPRCEIEKIILFAHGSERHDTILTVQVKSSQKLLFDYK
jgi:hypothetical protein